MIWIWISIWAVGAIISDILFVNMLAFINKSKYLMYLHEDMESASTVFICDLIWPIFWPMLIVVLGFVKLIEPIKEVEFNPIEFTIKFITNKKYIREKVMEEI